MAEKRMFAKFITESDDFLNMSKDAQCLYYHLCMYADDDGFINNTTSILRIVGSDIKYLEELKQNKYFKLERDRLKSRFFAFTNYPIINDVNLSLSEVRSLICSKHSLKDTPLGLTLPTSILEVSLPSTTISKRTVLLPFNAIEISFDTLESVLTLTPSFILTLYLVTEGPIVYEIT